MTKRFLTCFLAVVLLISCVSFTACDQQETELEKFSTYSFDYFDTVTTVTGYAESQEVFDVVAADILAQLADYHRLFTIYHRYEGLENLVARFSKYCESAAVYRKSCLAEE